MKKKNEIDERKIKQVVAGYKSHQTRLMNLASTKSEKGKIKALYESKIMGYMKSVKRASGVSKASGEPCGKADNSRPKASPASRVKFVSDASKRRHEAAVKSWVTRKANLAKSEAGGRKSVMTRVISVR